MRFAGSRDILGVLVPQSFVATAVKSLPVVMTTVCDCEMRKQEKNFADSSACTMVGQLLTGKVDMMRPMMGLLKECTGWLVTNPYHLIN